MKKVVDNALKKLQKAHNSSIKLERISGSMLRVIYDTSVYSFVEDERLQDIVAKTATGGYGMADTSLRRYGIITLNFNTTEQPIYATKMYEDTLDGVLNYIKSCCQE